MHASALGKRFRAPDADPQEAVAEAISNLGAVEIAAQLVRGDDSP
jgi:hypothetical protein